MELYPDLKWGFISSDAHSVAVGFRDHWKQPELVMDILLFRTLTAEESLTLAMAHGMKFYGSLNEYLASFCANPKAGLKVLEDLQEAYPSAGTRKTKTKRQKQVSIGTARSEG